MARVKLDLPEGFAFALTVALGEADMNHGGHLGAETLFGHLGAARRAFYRSLGWEETDVAGAGTIMSDAVIVYRAEAFAGETLRIEVTAGDFGRVGCDLFYRVAKADGTEVARAKTAIGFLDYATHRIVPVPAAFRAHFP